MAIARFPSALLTLLTFFSLLHITASWGTLGHRTIAYLAEKYLTDEGSLWVNGLLDGEDIADASLWADEIKHRPIGAGTAEWHYIDSKDDPPRQCNVNYNRDCIVDKGCVVSAIINMTDRAIDASLTPSENLAALKFLLHFIGDIHQPLHTENEDRGGNDIHVLFRRKHTNLHAIWDTDILELMNGGKPNDENRQAAVWAESLFRKNGRGGGSGSCTNVRTAQKCALTWATEANGYVCSYVLKDDVEGVEGRDLSGEYFEGAVPIVETLVANAGFRLGAWLNGLAAESAASLGRASGEL